MGLMTIDSLIMKKFSIFFLVALATMLIACSSDYEHYVLEIPETPIIPEIVAETIPLSDALDEMFSVFELLPAPEGRLRSTRSAMEQQMSVATIYAHQVGATTRFATRGTSEEEEDVPLLYVVNFEEGGFSILAASTHIPATVIAISNENSFSPHYFSNEGSGFVPCDDLCPDFQFFNAAENDYYVASGDEIGNFIAGMIVSFATSPQWPVVCPYAPGGDFGGTVNHWRTVRQVGPLLQHMNVSRWGQGYPFNAAAPKRNVLGGSLLFTARAPVGCVPLALAQIITFNEFPRQFNTWNGRTAHWSEIQQFASWSSSTTNAGFVVATMLKGIGIGVFAIYTRNWTFALPANAGNFLRLIGYQNVQVHRTYYEDGILNMLRNNKPVFVAAVSGITNGHAWVIDGYMVRERNSVTGHTQQMLVHCVFGWWGRSNGWYESGIFNASRGGVIPTNGYTGSGNWNKNNWIFRTITYRVP